MRKQQNKRTFSQLSAADADFINRKGNHEAQTESRANVVDWDNSLNDRIDAAQVNGSKLDMHILERTILGKIRSEVDNVMTTVETRVRDALLIAIGKLILPRIELAMKSFNASYGHEVGSVVLDLDQGDFPSNFEGLQLTTISRKKSHAD